MEAPAQLAPLGESFLVNTYTTGQQSSRSGAGVAVAADGRFLVAWGNREPQDGSSTGLFGQFYDGGGQAEGTEFQVNTHTTNWQGYYGADIAALPDGGFVVVWDSDGQDGYGLGVFARKFDSAGATVGGEFQVNSYTSGTQGYFRGVASTGGGAFVVIWHTPHENPNLMDVVGQRFSSDGGQVGVEFRVNTVSYQFQGVHGVDVASPEDGSFVVAFSGYVSGQEGNNSDVRVRRYDSDGAPIGEAFVVNTFTTGRQAYYGPSIASAPDGAFVVVWSSEDQDGAGYGIFGQRFDSLGVSVAAEFQVNTYTTNNQYTPDVAVDGDGSFVVVWDSRRRSAGTAYGIYGQRFNSDGSPDGTEFAIDALATGEDQRSTAIAGDGNGGFVVVWDRKFGAPTYDMYGRRFVVGEEVADVALASPGSVTTDSEADGATADDAVESTVGSPNPGTVRIIEDAVSTASPVGFRFLGQEVALTAPDATAEDPLILTFEIDESVIPVGHDETTIEVFRDAVGPIGPCTGSTGHADPDPCVADRVRQGDGDIVLTLHSSTASNWNIAVASICGAQPSTSCRRAGDRGSRFQIRDRASASKDQLKWQWKKGQATLVDDFADPVDGAASYALCVFDGSVTAQPAMDSALAAGGVCGNQACWRATGTKGFKYKDKAGASAGLVSIKLRGGDDGRASIRLAARGENLIAPAPALALPVTVEFVVQDGATRTCWQAVFSEADRNDSEAGVFSASGS